MSGEGVELSASSKLHTLLWLCCISIPPLHSNRSVSHHKCVYIMCSLCRLHVGGGYYCSHPGVCVLVPVTLALLYQRSKRLKCTQLKQLLVHIPVLLTIILVKLYKAARYVCDDTWFCRLHWLTVGGACGCVF